MCSQNIYAIGSRTFFWPHLVSYPADTWPWYSVLDIPLKCSVCSSVAQFARNCQNMAKQTKPKHQCRTNFKRLSNIVLSINFFLIIVVFSAPTIFKHFKDSKLSPEEDHGVDIIIEFQCEFG